MGDKCRECIVFVALCKLFGCWGWLHDLNARAQTPWLLSSLCTPQRCPSPNPGLLELGQVWMKEFFSHHIHDPNKLFEYRTFIHGLLVRRGLWHPLFYFQHVKGTGEENNNRVWWICAVHFAHSIEREIVAESTALQLVFLDPAPDCRRVV